MKPSKSFARSFGSPQNVGATAGDPRLGRAERTEMRNFIDHAWKELVFLESDQRRVQSKANSCAGSASVIKPEVKKLPPGTILADLRATGSIRSRMEETAKISPRSSTNSTILIQYHHTIESLSKAGATIFMTQTDGFDLRRQVEERTEGRHQVVRALHDAEKRRQLRITAKQAEWDEMKQRLSSIQAKLKRAGEKQFKSTFTKMLEAARSSSNCMSWGMISIIATLVQERAQERSEETTQSKQRQYITKAFKIEEKKRLREAKLKEEMEKRRQGYIEKKLHQDEEYQRQRQREQKQLSIYAAELEMKQQRIRNLVSVYIHFRIMLFR